ncbi:hypothetical protein [Ornithinimicrobium avium]|uniref:hypothetical protein n=1 Tax=Ornithinimicrobium avium TaxID=2283195 RepID=UPI0013B3EA1B|nr:hypothetical protein [Ornithinimicrobium avium]
MTHDDDRHSGRELRRYKRVAQGVVALAVASTVACSVDTSETADGGAAAAATYAMDWAEYDSVDQLTRQSQYAVLVDLKEAEGGWETPDYSSDDPRINPYAGTNYTPSPAQIKAAALPVTRFSAKVVDFSRGDGSATTALNVGSEITVQQAGGWVGGELYVVSGMEPLREGDTVLLFVRESPISPGVFVITGGPAGTFRPTAKGEMISGDGRMKLSAAEFSSLLEGE